MFLHFYIESQANLSRKGLIFNPSPGPLLTFSHIEGWREFVVSLKSDSQMASPSGKRLTASFDYVWHRKVLLHYVCCVIFLSISSSDLKRFMA